MFLEECLSEPQICSTMRCTNSVRVRQLWYFSKTAQVISSFTDTSIPPLGPSRTRELAAAAGLINVPKCLASRANTAPPQPPKPPPAVDITLPLQVWAAPLAAGVAVVLVNADEIPANISAEWLDLGLPEGVRVRVRDAICHSDNGTSTGPLVAKVMPHDVVVVVLTPV